MSRLARYTKAEMCIAASRIAELRKMVGWQQERLAVHLGEVSPTHKVYSTPTISAWETGKRAIPNDAAEAYSSLFGVDKEYVVGLIDVPCATEEERKPSLDDLIHKVALRYDELFGLNGKPVYVKFPLNDHTSGWGLVHVADVDTVEVMMLDRTLACKDPLQYKLYALDGDFVALHECQAKHKLSMGNIIGNKEPVWVQMETLDPVVMSTFNGWYTLKKVGREYFLQNRMGATLSLAGMNHYYSCYREKPTL